MSKMLASLCRVAALGLALGALTGCNNPVDPCVRLAERICNCELSEATRRQCRSDRIDPNQDPFVLRQGNEEECLSALSTCTCQALDDNQTELCGFTVDPGEEPGPSEGPIPLADGGTAPHDDDVDAGPETST